MSYEIMTDSSSSEIELELYEEVINMNYSTPMASRASSPLSHDHKNSSGDEIADVNFFYKIAHVEASAYAH